MIYNTWQQTKEEEKIWHSRARPRFYNPLCFEKKRMENKPGYYLQVLHRPIIKRFFQKEPPSREIWAKADGLAAKKRHAWCVRAGLWKAIGLRGLHGTAWWMGSVCTQATTSYANTCLAAIGRTLFPFYLA